MDRYCIDGRIGGEWDWGSTTSLVESNGIWSTQVNLSEGMYCYKFIVDGEYTFDPQIHIEDFVTILRIPLYE